MEFADAAPVNGGDGGADGDLGVAVAELPGAVP